MYVDILFEGLNRYFEDLAVTVGDILAFKPDFLKYKRGDIHAEFWWLMCLKPQRSLLHDKKFRSVIKKIKKE